MSGELTWQAGCGGKEQQLAPSATAAQESNVFSGNGLMGLTEWQVICHNQHHHTVALCFEWRLHIEEEVREDLYMQAGLQVP
jgi:hypothetical protein